MERAMTNNRHRIGLLFCRGRAASASGLIFSSPAKVSLRRSKEKVFLHHSAVHFSTGGPVQFSPGIYRCTNSVCRSYDTSLFNITV
jgi:hypothetical protein